VDTVDERDLSKSNDAKRATGEVGKSLADLVQHRRRSSSHGNGWFHLVWRLCESLEPVVATIEKETGCSFEGLQVKEKFGGLRFHSNCNNDLILTPIKTFELESFHICEVCGQPMACDGWREGYPEEFYNPCRHSKRRIPARGAHNVFDHDI
jgi:hypothetical protein